MLCKKDIILLLKNALRKKDFWEFCLYYDNEFFTKRAFAKEIAEALQLIAEKKIKTLAISLPPRSGKSYLTSLFCAWWIGNNPTQSVMRNSCTARLYQKLSYDVRKIVKSQKFQDIFPKVCLSDDKQNVNGWNVTEAKQVSYFGAGVGGAIIGFGANLAISDDLFKGINDALSSVVQDSTHIWKEGDHDSRKEKDCCEIYIGTRWTKNDVIGRAFEKELIELDITIPALIDDNKGGLISFCEHVKSTEEYLKIKNDIDEEIFEAEYQQNPVELKGTLFPKSQLNFYNPELLDVEKLVEYKHLYVDPANEGGDDLAAPLGYLIKDKIYIPEVIYNNNGTDINEPAIVSMVQRFKINSIEIEANSAWYLFADNVYSKINNLRLNTECRAIKSTTNKHTRILSQSAFIRNNFIFRSDWEKNPEYKKFITVLTAYMREGNSNKRDDAPDAATGLAMYFARNFQHLY